MFHRAPFPVLPALALLCSACSEPDAAPVLTRCAPERAARGSLPMSGMVEGERLSPSLAIRLDDGSSATSWPVQARLGGVALKDVLLFDGSKVQFTVPSELAAGAHDFELELGPGRSARLARALTIVEDGSVPSPDAGLLDGGILVEEPPPDEPVEYPAYAGCGQFGAPTPVTVLGMTGRTLWSPALSTDARKLYFAITGTLGDELWTATRADRDSVFSGALALPDLVGGGDNGTPFPSGDGLSLYFTAAPPGSVFSDMSGRDLYRASRATVTAPFENAQPLAELNSSDRDQLPWVSRDELTIIFSSERSGTSRLYTATRSSRSASFSAPVLLPGVAGGSDNRPFLTPDHLGLFLSSNRPGTVGSHDLWFATRPTATGPFGPPRNLSVLNSTNTELDVTLTQDGTELFFILRDAADDNQLLRALAACP
jgi:hypothetical protein